MSTLGDAHARAELISRKSTQHESALGSIVTCSPGAAASQIAVAPPAPPTPTVATTELEDGALLELPAPVALAAWTAVEPLCVVDDAELPPSPPVPLPSAVAMT